MGYETIEGWLKELKMFSFVFFFFIIKKIIGIGD
jgi:hypothetical protein